MYVTFHLGYPTVLPASDSSALNPICRRGSASGLEGIGGIAGGDLSTSGGEVATASFREEDAITPGGEDLIPHAIDHLGPRDRENVARQGFAVGRWFTECRGVW